MKDAIQGLVTSLMEENGLTVPDLLLQGDILFWNPGEGVSVFENRNLDYEEIDLTYTVGAYARIKAKLEKLFKEVLEAKGFLVIHLIKAHSEIAVKNFSKENIESLDFKQAYSRERVVGIPYPIYIGYEKD